MSQCVTRVQMNISCRNLQDKDVMSKSDPMAVVMMLKDGSWFEVNDVCLYIVRVHKVHCLSFNLHLFFVALSLYVFKSLFIGFLLGCTR